jgi:hypothetical protein
VIEEEAHGNEEHTSVCNELSTHLTTSTRKRHAQNQLLVLYGQATKRIRWMPWQSEAMKDVVTCDKLRGVGKQTLIRRFPNGGTQLV